MQRLFRRPLQILLCLALLSFGVYADEMQIFELKGATPREIIPLIKPFVGPDGTVTGMHNQLIVRTSAERMAEVRKIIQEFDRAPRRLLIHVRDSAPSEGSSTGVDLSVNTPRVKIGRGENTGLSVRHYSTQRNETNRRTLQTLEGQPTLIASGIIRPEVTRGGWIIGPRGGYQTSVDYRNIESGFYATVQLVGERVRIEIDTQKQSPLRGSPAVSHQTTENVISGNLGQWLLLATTSSERHSEGAGIDSYDSSGSSGQSEVWVMVELLPD